MTNDWRMIRPTPLFNEQVREELKIPITHDKYPWEEDTCTIYYGTYLKLPDIYVQTEDGKRFWCILLWWSVGGTPSTTFSMPPRPVAVHSKKFASRNGR